MLYLVHKPRSPLCEHVDYLWSMRDAPSHARERIVPSGTVELVINLAADEFRMGAPDAQRYCGALVSGCYRQAFEIDTRSHASIMGVHFRPGGAVLLGLPPGVIADTHVELAALWGSEVSFLRERLCEARDDAGRFAILEHALCVRMAEPPRQRQLIAAALPQLEHPDGSVAAVARELGVSQRHFIQVFTEQVGMTPKRYARVRRFQRALTLANRAQPLPWAELAVKVGYFDQAHLCHDWRELTGLSPADLIALRETHVKDLHVALS